ncbi:MAG: hypothetical protein L0215_13485 [Gemmataceae bacterium]|nr:hypothetical protein [Gemmataceae bacterium]
MNAKILCNWLGIPEKAWPPDPYTLLGLQPGDADPVRIEQRVQDRMARLRSFQLSFPDEATEGLNRIAQAFISLTEKLARNGKQNAASESSSNGKTMTMYKEDTIVNGMTVTDWKAAPPPVRSSGSPVKTGEDAAVPVPVNEAVFVSYPVAAPYAPPPCQPPTSDSSRGFQESLEARRGLGTLPAVMERGDLTRHMIIAWDQAGKHLRDPQRLLTKPAEEVDLTRWLHHIFELMAEFPKVFGYPGMPGYRVVAMARLEMTAQMFKMLDASQRECLARDWAEGRKLLLAYRKFVRQQFKTLRRRSPPNRVFAAIRHAINDHPILVAVGSLVAVAAVFYVGWVVL